MSSLGTYIETSKTLAAKRQIDAAVVHIQRAELECAITLAAAAENLLPDTAEPHVLAYLRGHPSYKKGHSESVDFNETINWLKHDTKPDTKVIFEKEAALIIVRAMSKYAAVHNEGSSPWASFIEWGETRGHWPKI